MSKETQALKDLEEVYEEERTQAKKAYEEVMLPLWRAHPKILIHYEKTKTKAEKDYEEAVNPAMIAYYRARVRGVWNDCARENRKVG